MATTYRIHPAIGIARVGNSPEDYFIAPERPFQHPLPDDGLFKDGELRVKRQAARFRVFAHHDDGHWEEITAEHAEIAWTVHLANRKAADPRRGNAGSEADLVIDPGARRTDGPLQSRRFDGGSIRFEGQAPVQVALGEMRTDADNRLLVLGAMGHAASPANAPLEHFWRNPGWYDDVADGPVSATLRLRASGEEVETEGAWVIVAPPKFAPDQDSITTLYDRVLQTQVDAGLVPTPSSTSYLHDIYPILQRTRDLRWVLRSYVHPWSEPVVEPERRAAIYARISPTDMPRLSGQDRFLTPVQYAHLTRWRDGDFIDDWAGLPRPAVDVTPESLDRAALDAGVGASFFPGIEAGGLPDGPRPIIEAATYRAPFRVDHARVRPGTLTQPMALPWQADFWACSGTWWPVPRPDKVFPEDADSQVEWARDLGGAEDMVARWHALGFVVERDGRHVEVQRTPAPTVRLLTPVLDFGEVEAGPMGMVFEHAQPIEFEVRGPEALTLEIEPDSRPTHAQLVVPEPSIRVDAGAGGPRRVALWAIYRTGAPGSALPPISLALRCPETGDRWSVDVQAGTIARRGTAAALLLERSAGMAGPFGDRTRLEALRQAAVLLVETLQDGEAVGVVRYHHDAEVLLPVTTLASGADGEATRAQACGLIRGPGLTPSGRCSPGDALALGWDTVQAAPQPRRALVLAGAHRETDPRFLAEVADAIDAPVHALMLGAPAHFDTAALDALTANTGGSLHPVPATEPGGHFPLARAALDLQGRLQQTQTVVDQTGRVLPGRIERLRFDVSEADAGFDVYVLLPDPERFHVRLQTPSGYLIDPWRATRDRGMRFVRGTGFVQFRVVLPVQLLPRRFDHVGTWSLWVEHGRLRTREEPADEASGIAAAGGPAVPEPAAAVGRPRSCGGAATSADESEWQYAVMEACEAAAEAGVDAALAEQARSAGAPGGTPLLVRVHAHSNLRMTVTASASGHAPGSSLKLQAELSQSGLPLASPATVWAEVLHPDGTHRRVAFAASSEPGLYDGHLDGLSAGVHQVRVLASGRTRRGQAFQRLHLARIPIWQPMPIAARVATPAAPDPVPSERVVAEVDAPL